MAHTSANQEELAIAVLRLLAQLRSDPPQITPAQAFIELQRYAFAGDLIAKHRRDLAGAALANPRLFSDKLITLLQESVIQLKDLPQFQNEIPKKQLTPAEIVARAESFTTASSEARDAVSVRQNRYKQRLRPFIEKAVEAFSRDSVLTQLRQPITDFVLAEAEREPTSPDRALDTVARVATRFPETQNLDTERMRVKVAQELQGERTALTSEAQRVESFRETVSDVLTNPTITRPHLYIRIIEAKFKELEQPDAPQETPEDVTRQYETRARQAEAVSQKISAVARVSDYGVFFQAYAKGSKKLASQAFDMALMAFPEDQRGEIINAILARTWQEIQKTPDNLGKTIVGSQFFNDLVRQGNQELAQRVVSGNAVANSFLNFTWSLFGGPNKEITEYINTLALNNTLPPSQRLFIEQPLFTAQYMYIATVAASPQHHDGFLQFLMQLAGSYAKEQAAKEIGKQVVVRGAGAAAGAASRGAISALLARIGGFAAGAAIPIPGLNIVLGFLGGFVGDHVLKFFGKIPKAVIGISASMTGGSNKKEASFGLVVAIMVTIVVILLIPFITNAQYLQHAAQSSAVAEGVGGGQEEEEFGAPVTFSYDGALPPESEITGCPVTGGSITQCPNGSYSHGGIDAYDITGVNHQPIAATHLAYVAVYRTGIPEGSGFGFGNYVRLVGTRGGKTYFTTYGHMLGVSDRLVEAAQARPICEHDPDPQKKKTACETALIHPGEIIGYVDDTGHSSGAHVHYQYNDNYNPADLLRLPMGCAGFTGSCSVR